MFACADWTSRGPARPPESPTGIATTAHGRSPAPPGTRPAGQQGSQPGVRRSRPDPAARRTRRLLHHHRPHRHRRPGRLPLRRPLVDRGLLPRRQAGPRRPGPADLETPRPRTRRQPVPAAARPHLVLVSRHPPHRRHLDHPPPAPAEEHAQLPRRPRRAAPRALVTTNYSAVSPAAEDSKITDVLLDTLAYAA